VKVIRQRQREVVGQIGGDDLKFLASWRDP
jgi:hypothetical protein